MPANIAAEKATAANLPNVFIDYGFSELLMLTSCKCKQKAEFMQVFLRKTANGVAKDRLSACKRRHFARQKTANWKVADCQWLIRPIRPIGSIGPNKPDGAGQISPMCRMSRMRQGGGLSGKDLSTPPLSGRVEMGVIPGSSPRGGWEGATFFPFYFVILSACTNFASDF